MAKLKPCPFCGMPAIVWRHRYPSGDTYYDPVVLHKIGCVFEHMLWYGDYESKDELAAAWNRRAGEDDLIGKEDP